MPSIQGSVTIAAVYRSMYCTAGYSYNLTLRLLLKQANDVDTYLCRVNLCGDSHQ